MSTNPRRIEQWKPIELNPRTIPTVAELCAAMTSDAWRAHESTATSITYRLAADVGRVTYAEVTREERAVIHSYPSGHIVVFGESWLVVNGASVGKVSR